MFARIQTSSAFVIFWVDSNTIISPNTYYRDISGDVKGFFADSRTFFRTKQGHCGCSSRVIFISSFH